MSLFRNSRSRGRSTHSVERDLRALRAAPRQTFVRELAAAITPTRAPRAKARLGLAAVFTIVVAVGLASIGGVGYAQTVVNTAARTVQRATEPLGLTIIEKPTSAQDQYSEGNGNHDVKGSNGADTIKVGNGNDIIIAGGGNDRITAGDGNNRINGGAGNDVIHTGNGNNVVRGGTGHNTIVTGRGNDRIYAGADGGNHVNAGAGNDIIYAANRHRDFVNGGPGRDTCIVDRIDRVTGCEIIHRH